MRYVILLIATLLTGCVGAGPMTPASLGLSDKAMESLLSSERSWCLAITSGFGMVRAGGSGIQGGTMSCSQEGFTVKDDASRVTVPITVTPQITVAPTAPVK